MGGSSHPGGILFSSVLTVISPAVFFLWFLESAYAQVVSKDAALAASSSSPFCFVAFDVIIIIRLLGSCFVDFIYDFCFILPDIGCWINESWFAAKKW